MFWIIIMAFVVLMALAIVIYMLPSDAPAKAAKKKKEKKGRFSIRLEDRSLRLRGFFYRFAKRLPIPIPKGFCIEI